VTLIFAPVTLKTYGTQFMAEVWKAFVCSFGSKSFGSPGASKFTVFHDHHNVTSTHDLENVIGVMRTWY